MMHPIVSNLQPGKPLAGTVIKEEKQPSLNDHPPCLLEKRSRTNVHQALIENRWLT